MKKILLTLTLLVASLFAQKPVVMVTIDPQKYFVEKIAQDRVIIKTLFKESNFQVKFKQLTLKKLADSDIYMIMGLDVEKPFLEDLKDINSDLEIFDMSQGIKKLKSNGMANPYVWMDPLKVRDLARTIFTKLSELTPKNRSFYEKNYKQFLLELDEIYLKIKILYSDVNFAIYTFDPYWNYFADRFDIPLYIVEKRVLDANETPKFIKKSKKRNVRVVLADMKTARNITKSISTNANARIVRDDIFKYDWKSNLYMMAEKLKKKSRSKLRQE